MLSDDIKITTEILWRGTLIFALLDAIYVPLLVWRVKPEIFRRVKWVLVVVAGVFWFSIWTWAISNFWETIYAYVFPAWGRYLVPPIYGIFMALICLGLWALALRVRLNPVLGYCLFGGVCGSLTHIWAVYRGIVTKPPVLQGASPVAAVVIAFFEFMFYWCVILTLSALGRWVWDFWWRKRADISMLNVTSK